MFFVNLNNGIRLLLPGEKGNYSDHNIICFPICASLSFSAVFVT